MRFGDVGGYPDFCRLSLKGKLGADNLLSADVHLDEANPHMHVLFMPLEHCKKKGRLVWRSTLDKRGRELYEGFFDVVGKRYGLDKPISLTSTMRAALALAVIEMMHKSADGAASSRAWEAIKIAIKANPKPFAVQVGINLKTFASGQNPLGTFENVENGATLKLPPCVRSFESLDLETGELRAI
jgi:Plasmid recombination enzyme